MVFCGEKQDFLTTENKVTKTTCFESYSSFNGQLKRKYLKGMYKLNEKGVDYGAGLPRLEDQLSNVRLGDHGKLLSSLTP